MNLSESVKQRLKNIATNKGQDINSVFQYYVMERFLCRVSKSPHAQFLILKGALMLRVLGGPLFRATRDIDFQMGVPTNIDEITEIMRQCASIHIEDGVRFDPDSIKASQIQFDVRDRGARIELMGYMGTARNLLQIDIGGGGEIIPRPSWVEYPTLLNFEVPKLLGYPKESIVADKFEAMVSRDLTNSRLKDFYDIWVLSEADAFEGAVLKDAVHTTFAHYNTMIPVEQPVCLSPEYYGDSIKQSRWRAFLKTAQIDTELPLEQAVTRIDEFLMPMCKAISKGTTFEQIWNPGGPWKKTAGSKR